MKKRSKKSKPQKRTFRYPARGMSEIVAMSRALDKVRNKNIDELKESIRNEAEISAEVPVGARGGVLSRNDIFQGCKLDNKKVSPLDYLREYVLFHEEAEKAVAGKVAWRRPRKWEWKPRNTYKNSLIKKGEKIPKDLKKRWKEGLLCLKTKKGIKTNGRKRKK